MHILVVCTLVCLIYLQKILLEILRGFLFLCNGGIIIVSHDTFSNFQSDERTQEEILAFFANHVSAVKNIYSKTEFHTYDYAMKYVGVDFVVQRTSVSTLHQNLTAMIGE